MEENNVSFIEIISELQARFGWNDDWKNSEIEIKNYPFNDIFHTNALNNGNCDISINFSENCQKISNKNGLIYYNGKWATRKLKTQPQYWFVEKDINNPVWEIYENEYFKSNVKNSNDKYFYCNIPYGNTSINLLHELKNHQYITLEQWYKFIFNPTKYLTCLFWNNENEDIRILGKYDYKNENGLFVDLVRNEWKYCKPIYDYRFISNFKHDKNKLVYNDNININISKKNNEWIEFKENSPLPQFGKMVWILDDKNNVYMGYRSFTNDLKETWKIIEYTIDKDLISYVNKITHWSEINKPTYF